MNAIQQFANQLTDETRILIVFASLLVFIVLENWRPLFTFEYRRLRHISFNLIFVVTSGIVTLTLAAIAFELIGIDDVSWGLLPLLNAPVWLTFIISLALLDFFGHRLPH